MVEYVLGGSPTNKESPLSGLEPRLRSLKFDDNDKVSTDLSLDIIDIVPNGSIIELTGQPREWPICEAHLS